MPDHVRAAKADPPNFQDRSWANTWSLVMAGLALVSGVVAIFDVVSFGDWYASHALESIATPVQLALGAVLTLGSVTTALGVLARPKGWKPSASIILERAGWQVIGCGWTGIAIAMASSARPGTSLTIIIVTFLVLGCYAKSLYLKGVLLDLKLKVAAQRANLKTGEQRHVQGV